MSFRQVVAGKAAIREAVAARGDQALGREPAEHDFKPLLAAIAPLFILNGHPARPTVRDTSAYRPVPDDYSEAVGVLIPMSDLRSDSDSTRLKDGCVNVVTYLVLLSEKA